MNLTIYHTKCLRGLFSLILVAATPFLSSAQSIYSFEGLGTLNFQGMPNNIAMGEVGIGSPTLWHVNAQNPANLVYNTFSTFQVGVEVENRRFSGENISSSASSGGLRFLGYAFPIMPGKWSSSIAVTPLTNVDYNTFSSGAVPGLEGAIQNVDMRGEGGLSQFSWSNGFRIKKKFLVGVRFNYTFGAIDRTSLIAISGSDVASNFVSYRQEENYSDVNLMLGFGYRYKLEADKFINFGLIYSSQSSMSGSFEESLSRLASSGQEIESQSVSSSNLSRNLPQTIGFGTSYEYLNVLRIGLDIESQGWSKAARSTENFNNMLRLAVGADWTPEFDDVNSYWRRIRYSFGLNYQRLPYIVNNQSLTDFGINFGASLPVSGYSSLDMAFKWGQLGQSSDGLIKETYFRVVLGATINDRWFIQRKYD